MESTFQKISRKTGKKPTGCKCQLCKSQCMGTPCLPTPEDVGKLIAAGYTDRLSATIWGAGMMMGLNTGPILIIAPTYDKQKGACTFFTDGLCELHDQGLKPTEGKLSHHTTSRTNFDPKRSISWHVAKEWIGTTEEQIENLLIPAP